jgi:Phage tail lysozyme
MVVLGVLAAAPQLHNLASAGRPSAAAGRLASGATVSAVSETGDHSATFRAARDRPWPTPTPVPAATAATRRHRRRAPARPGPAAQPAASPAPGASPRPAASGSAGSAPVCAGGGGLLPENVAAIVDFLTAHGYTGLAAAGIAGNIYQESGGNPESVGDGGGGLIGWTPLPAGYVTGNTAADLQTQLQAVLAYNQQWAQFIPALNAATSASQAADIYVQDFERAGVPAAGTREQSAQAVAAACGL